MDQELFRHWLKDHFLKYAVPSRPLLLLMDGHSSHYEPSSVELAKENDSSCSVYHHIQLRILSLLIALSLVLSSVTGRTFVTSTCKIILVLSLVYNFCELFSEA